MCQNKLPVKIKELLSPGGVLQPIYEYVPCRKCEECVSLRKSQWCFRALQETEHCYDSIFLTLTYDDEHLPKDKSVSVRDVQLFFKRLRRNSQLWYPEFDREQYPIRYFLVSEYGGKYGRPHYHLILWNCPCNWNEIEKCWQNGFIKIGDTTPKSVQYCLKYFAIKEKAPKGRSANFCCMSKNIGHQWLSDNLSYVKSYVVMPGAGYKIPLPKYYKDRIPGYYDVNPKKEYTWQYEPAPYTRFSTKFLRSRGLFGRPSTVNNMSIQRLNSLYDDAYNYFLYRDECFHRKYDKSNKRDNQ